MDEVSATPAWFNASATLCSLVIASSTLCAPMFSSDAPSVGESATPAQVREEAQRLSVFLSVVGIFVSAGSLALPSVAEHRPSVCLHLRSVALRFGRFRGILSPLRLPVPPSRPRKDLSIVRQRLRILNSIARPSCRNFSRRLRRNGLGNSRFIVYPQRLSDALRGQRQPYL